MSLNKVTNDLLEETSTHRKIVSFYVQDQIFGLELGYIQEFVEGVKYTPIPGDSSFMIGMVNLRGRIVTVCDLRHRLFGKKAESEKCLIVIRSHEELAKVNYKFKKIHTSREPVAFIIDARGPIYDIENDKFSAAPRHGNQLGSEYYDEIVKLDDTLITILHIGKVIGSQDPYGDL